ncbi:alanine/glycine:cation symporter family protein [Deinococcus radiophilus]|uniref:Alanine:cation symporter family protein n=1 Tax=Deinococcus radiophilus TaxID=32062 RepID=A0A431W468_9DEIO|nr:alanine/glycine:cation symporter family protein [Deinococcus radiophilus]RTR30240.1 alanine:cation symporter family protein [Deinococcus radiophilus]UFA49968.1 alanine:cation symporter family protein [Deinococcus radiophilus]
MDALNSFIDWGNGLLWGSVLIYLLVGAGLFFTVATRGVQLRLFGSAWRSVLGSRGTAGSDGISSFQAFATGLASRVGTGNIAGVAIAISLGGPGAVFWMWMTALVGMSTALIESTLAQAYKVPDPDHGYRGGPAYYIRQGLGQGWMGSLFAVFLILAFGLVFNAVQSNSIVAAMSGYGVGALPLGLILAVLVAPIIFGGLKRVSRVAEVVVPIMAVLYLLVALYVIVTNAAELPAMFSNIFRSAFGLQAAAGGVAGGIAAALLNGVKRGLFSNEAGMGSAPNAAAAAEVDHPVQQGLVQMLGVFVDTILVCTATAAIILLSGVHLGGTETGVQLTQAALTEHVGGWGNDFLALAIFLFAFTSIIGNYAYAESNVQYLNRNPAVLNIFRVLVLGMVVFGAVRDVPTVWNMADLSMGLMAVTNLIALLLLSPVALRLLRDYDRQRRAGQEAPVFERCADPELDRRLPSEVWK